MSVITLPLPNSCPKNPSPSPASPSKLEVTLNFPVYHWYFSVNWLNLYSYSSEELFQSKIIREWAKFMGKSTFFTGRKRSFPPPQTLVQNGVCPTPLPNLNSKSIAPRPISDWPKKNLDPIFYSKLTFFTKWSLRLPFSAGKKISPPPQFSGMKIL